MFVIEFNAKKIVVTVESIKFFILGFEPTFCFQAFQFQVITSEYFNLWLNLNY